MHRLLRLPLQRCNSSPRAVQLVRYLTTTNVLTSRSRSPSSGVCDGTGNAHTLDTDTTFDWDADESLFTFTRGRFMYDEEHQMAQRRVRFSMKELARVAASSIGADRCVRVQKCPDGLYNKAYIFRMDDGREVIGKVPNPNAGFPHYSTASEVATMDYVCIPPIPLVPTTYGMLTIHLPPTDAQCAVHSNPQGSGMELPP